MSVSTWNRAGRWRLFFVCLILAGQAGLLAWEAYRDSPTDDEVGHLAAGLSHWYTGEFSLYRVNPPLVRLVATAPIALFYPHIDVGFYPTLPDPLFRWEFRCGRAIADNLGQDYFWTMTLCRWAAIPFSLLGGLICYLWARDLWGSMAGLLSLVVWSFCPDVIAYGHLITPDIGAAALSIWACYAFWCWLRKPSWKGAFFAGSLLGAALLTKTTCAVLLVAMPTVWLIHQRGQAKGLRRCHALQLISMCLLALWVLNLGYGFSGSFQRLDSYRFNSTMLAGAPNTADRDPWRDRHNRFIGHWYGHILVPVPADYVYGVDLIKWEFEQKKWSYLCGQWKLGGWWYYYFAAIALKVPLTSLAIVLLALVATLAKPYRRQLEAELVLILPAAFMMLALCSQTGFNQHLRYAMPVFPFACVWLGKVARLGSGPERAVACSAMVLAACSLVSELHIFPHSMSYFNIVGGGPTYGHLYLGHSNTDWGQDLLYIKRWTDRHPRARPLFLAYEGFVNPATAGMAFENPAAGKDAWEESGRDYRMLPKPGWYVVSVNRLHWMHDGLDYLRMLKPVASIGYTTRVFKVTDRDVQDILSRWRNHEEVGHEHVWYTER